MVIPEIMVSIYGLESIVYEGKVKAISSKNIKGKFDIVPFHTNFISIIQEYLILHERSGSKKKFNLKSGVLKVVGNKVTIFLDVEGLKESESPNS